MFDHTSDTKVALTENYEISHYSYSGLESLREKIPISSYSRISELSLYYEKAWTQDRVLSIEDCLPLVEEDDREELFCRLLEIDVAMGFMHHAVISQEEYIERFPKWESIINETYTSFSQQSISGYGRLGSKIGHYEILEVLGKGAMGIVYKAWDEHLQRVVAIKYLLPQTHRDENQKQQMVDLFRREVALMGQLKRNTMFAQAYDSDRDGDFQYLVMEYVDGQDLAKYVTQEHGRLTFLEAIGYIRQIAEGLAEIHERGIVHRDIKPENVIRGQDGTVRILDLGLGVLKEPSMMTQSVSLQSLPDSRPSTATTEIMESAQLGVAGTPAYWSPEAYFEPDSVDGRSDLFSLGGTFFFLLTGIVPIRWRNPIDVRPHKRKHSLKDFLGKHGVILPPEGLMILEKLLETNPAQRYATAKELIEALDAVQQKYAPRSWYSRWKRTIQAVGIVLLLVISTLIAGTFLHLRKDLRQFQSAIKLAEAGQETEALTLLIDVNPKHIPKTQQQAFFLLRANLYNDLAKDEEYQICARENYENVLALNPKNVEARNKHIRLGMELGKKQEARDEVIQVLKQNPGNIEYQILDAEIQIQMAIQDLIPLKEKERLFDSAQNILTEVLKVEPENTEALYWRAKANQGLNKISSALTDLQKLLDLDHEYPPAWLLCADLHFLEKNYTKALEEWSYIASRNPTLTHQEWSEVYFKCAQCYFYLADFKKCIEFCNNSAHEALVVPPLLLKFRGESEFEIGEWRSAIQDFSTLLNQDLFYLFSLNELNGCKIKRLFCYVQLAETLQEDSLERKDFLESCVAEIDSLFAEKSERHSVVFHGKEWYLSEIRAQANQLLGNEEAAREDAARLFEEMQQPEEVKPDSQQDFDESSVLESAELPSQTSEIEEVNKTNGSQMQ